MKLARIHRAVLAALLAAPLGLVSEPAAAADKPAAKPAGKAADKKAAKGPSQEEMMKAWQAYMTPGEAHQMLASSAGTWTAKVKSWMDPAQPPQESEGTAEMKMVLGGRYLEHRYEGTMMGQPFSGIGYTGFDNYLKKFQATWIDSMGTGVMMTSGTLAKDGKSLTMTGTFDDFVMKKKSKVKETLTFVNADTQNFEMWMEGPDGKMMKNLEIVYSRKK